LPPMFIGIYHRFHELAKSVTDSACANGKPTREKWDFQCCRERT
jgi:hypothetical protein